MASGFTPGVRATYLVTKKNGMSDIDFEKHYTEKHIPMVAEILRRHGALHYAVHFTNSKDKAAVQSLFGGAVNSVDCDAVVTLVFPDMKSLEATFADPDLPAKLHPDEKLFTEDDRNMVLGREYIVIQSDYETV